MTVAGEHQEKGHCPQHTGRSPATKETLDSLPQYPRGETKGFMPHCARVLCQSDSATPCSVHSLSGSPVHGVFQPRILEWAAIPFSKGSSWESCLKSTNEAQRIIKRRTSKTESPSVVGRWPETIQSLCIQWKRKVTWHGRCEAGLMQERQSRLDEGHAAPSGESGSGSRRLTP